MNQLLVEGNNGGSVDLNLEYDVVRGIGNKRPLQPPDNDAGDYELQNSDYALKRRTQTSQKQAKTHFIDLQSDDDRSLFHSRVQKDEVVYDDYDDETSIDKDDGHDLMGLAHSRLRRSSHNEHRHFLRHPKRYANQVIKSTKVILLNVQSRH